MIVAMFLKLSRISAKIHLHSLPFSTLVWLAEAQRGKQPFERVTFYSSGNWLCRRALLYSLIFLKWCAENMHRLWNYIRNLDWSRGHKWDKTEIRSRSKVSLIHMVSPLFLLVWFHTKKKKIYIWKVLWMEDVVTSKRFWSLCYEDQNEELKEGDLQGTSWSNVSGLRIFKASLFRSQNFPEISEALLKNADYHHKMA